MTCVILKTSRDAYKPQDCGYSVTVGKLIDILQEYNQNSKIYFSNDNGYTYGSIIYDSVDELEIGDEEKEEEEEVEEDEEEDE